MKFAKYNYTESARDIGLLILRIGIGFMFVMHGYPKMAGGPAKWAKIGNSMGTIGIEFLPAVWGFLGGFTELAGGVLLMLGLLFRPTNALLAFVMLIATLKHLSAGDGMMGSSHSIELGIVFIALFFIGPGKISLDKQLN